MLKYVFTKFIILSCVISSAQIHVRNEPRHHNVFENEYIRILDVYLGPKDTTQYHLHNTPSAFIILADCKVSSQLLGGQPQAGANVSGTISYDPMNTARTHRVWNEDTIWFHVMDIELISKNSKSNINVLNDPLLKLLFKEQLANGYDAKLNPGDLLKLPSSANGYLLVSKEEASIDYTTNKTTQHRLMKAGHYIWIEPTKEFSIRSAREKTANLVILQLK